MSRVYKRGDRGFLSFGKPFNDNYGALIEVYESSSAEGNFVWLKIEGGNANLEYPGPICAHLDRKQAKDLIDRLQTWINHGA